MSTGVGTGMQDRLDEIVRSVRTSGKVEVADLAEQFGVTTETIRRDLNELQDRRLVKRVHGGAVPWNGQRFEPDMLARDQLGAEQKRRIAMAALDELPPEGTVIIDSGSTSRLVVDFFPRDRALRVVTNSLLHASSLAAIERVEVFMVGGLVNPRHAVTDADAVETLRTMQVGTAIMSCDGVDAEAGFTTPYHDEMSVKRAIIESARRVVLLADHRKHGQVFMRRFADWHEIDTLITDDDGDPEQLERIRATGVSLVVV